MQWEEAKGWLTRLGVVCSVSEEAWEKMNDTTRSVFMQDARLASGYYPNNIKQKSENVIGNLQLQIDDLKKRIDELNSIIDNRRNNESFVYWAL